MPEVTESEAEARLHVLSHQVLLSHDKNPEKINCHLRVNENSQGHPFSKNLPCIFVFVRTPDISPSPNCVSLRPHKQPGSTLGSGNP